MKSGFLSRKVSNYLINPKFQLTLIGYFFILSLNVIIVNYLGIYYFFYKFKLKGESIGLVDTHPFFLFINEQQNFMNWTFLITSLVTFLFLFVIGIVVSHKIAGPIYRFCISLKKMSEEGKNSDIKFRDGDFFQEIASEFNKFRENLTTNKHGE